MGCATLVIRRRKEKNLKHKTNIKKANYNYNLNQQDLGRKISEKFYKQNSTLNWSIK